MISDLSSDELLLHVGVILVVLQSFDVQCISRKNNLGPHHSHGLWEGRLRWVPLCGWEKAAGGRPRAAHAAGSPAASERACPAFVFGLSEIHRHFISEPFYIGHMLGLGHFWSPPSVEKSPIRVFMDGLVRQSMLHSKSERSLGSKCHRPHTCLVPPMGTPLSSYTVVNLHRCQRTCTGRPRRALLRLICCRSTSLQ